MSKNETTKTHIFYIREDISEIKQSLSCLNQLSSRIEVIETKLIPLTDIVVRVDRLETKMSFIIWCVSGISTLVLSWFTGLKDIILNFLFR